MSHFPLPITCEQFEAQLSDYVDGALAPDDRAALTAHLAQCAACSALHAEISSIVKGAASLPVLSPSRDLWSGIAERLDTPVVSISPAVEPFAAHSATHATKRSRTVSFRVFAAAAALIVAVSSGGTYLLTRANPALQSDTTAGAVSVPVASSGTAPETAAPVIAAPSVVAPNVAVATPQRATNREGEPGERTRSRYASNDGSVELVYEREITAMRRIVDERLGDLDSVTVLEIERNLRIIDKAIEDSRRALQNDPRSRFLSTQLDRALENKLGILRRIALL